MKNIKEKLQKIGKFIISRMFYLILGICIAVAIPIAYAAWNSTVSSGQTLTTALWNEHVDKLIELNSKIDSWPPGSYCIMKNGVCPPGFNTRSLGLFVGAHAHDMCNVGNRSAGDSNCAGGSPMATLTIVACCK